LYRRAYANAVLLLLLTVLAVPAVAWAGSGGASPAGDSGGTTPTNRPGVQQGDVTATVSGGGFTLSARISALLRHELVFTGSVPASAAGNTVIVQRLDRHAGWVTTATATAAQGGSFSAVWRTNHIGRFATRVLLASGGGARSRDAVVSPALDVTVYRPSVSTTYGPGFYGSRTACGEILKRTTVGVANRSLPCGTSVAIYYDGRTMVVPVIDRGPYANRADWDLTEATARALGIGGTVTLGATSLPKSAR
jgi:hypothetical protein